MNSNTKSMLLNGFIGVGALLLVISCFSTYVSVLGGLASTSLIKGGDGYLFLALVAVTVVFALLNKNLVSLISSGVAMGLTLFELSDTSDKLSGYGSLITYNAGYYLMIIGSIVMLIATITKFVFEKKNLI